MEHRLKAVGLAASVSVVVFFVPMIPMNVPSHLLLPDRNLCATPSSTQGSIGAYASVSYVIFGVAIAHTTSHGTLGSVYAPGNGANSIQFPPLGFQDIMCG
jgi:hypothetical protein